LSQLAEVSRKYFRGHAMLQYVWLCSLPPGALPVMLIFFRWSIVNRHCLSYRFLPFRISIINCLTRFNQLVFFGNEDAVFGNEDTVFGNEDAVFGNEDAVFHEEGTLCPSIV
jgi:hypothetical protein